MIPIATRDSDKNVVIAAAEKTPTLVVSTSMPTPFSVAAGLRGAPGRDGAGGITYVQDYEPTGASEKETWWNPLTLQLKVYHDDQFEPVSPDGGHF